MLVFRMIVYSVIEKDYSQTMNSTPVDPSRTTPVSPSPVYVQPPQNNMARELMARLYYGAESNQVWSCTISV